MKKICNTLITVLLILLIVSYERISYASSIITPVSNKANTPDNTELDYLKASKFVKLSFREFSRLTGKKLSLFQKLSFKLTKMRIRHDLKKNPDLKITDYLNSERKGNSLWFLLGLIAPILGILTMSLLGFIIIGAAPLIIAYATKQNKPAIRAAWLGLGVGALVIIILGLIIASTISFQF